MHIIGVGGQMRRIYNPMQYEFLQHQQHWNVFITVSARSCSALAQIPFVDQLLLAPVRRARRRRMNPWNANTLEWTRALAAAAPELGADAADRVPRPLRVQLAGVEGRLPAADRTPPVGAARSARH